MATTTPPTPEPDTLTLYDLARLWGVSYTTVYEQARLNKLPVPVFRVGRRYLVSRKAYEEVMRKHHAPEPLDAA
jgi:excisionase family DNA binding protein